MSSPTSWRSSSSKKAPSGAFGAARNLVAPAAPQQAVCFSEVPLDRLDRLVERRGTKFGIGFSQEEIIAAGGGRVWYVDKDGPLAGAVHDVIDEAIGPPFRVNHPVWRITPFIDFPGDCGETQYRFEWEREWRVPAEFRFTTGDVAFLFIPEELQDKARKFFDDAREQNLGPACDCPFLDPLWSDEAIQNALANL